MKYPVQGKTINIPESFPGSDPGIGLGDIAKYGAIFGEIVDRINAARSLIPGDKMETGMIKLNIGNKEFEWDLGSITRKK